MDAALQIIKSKTWDQKLWNVVMNCFLGCFTNDASGFMNQERFDKVMTALVDQLEVNAEDPAYDETMMTIMIPVLGNLAKACEIEAARKALNKSVLMKTRSEVSNVRWAALCVVSELYNQLGEDMLAFFPETIPFLAELMDDDDSRVEQVCQQLCKQIEEFLGEPIDQYFSAN